MSTHFDVAVIAVVFLAIVKSGVSLQCWSCDTDQNQLCADHFNKTEFYRGYPYNTGGVINQPQLQLCSEGGNVYQFNQKPMCLKKKQTYAGSSRVLTIRQCTFVDRNTQPGTCPPQTTSQSVSVDFCELCETEGCNGASNIQMSLAAIIPAAILLLLRK